MWDSQVDFFSRLPDFQVCIFDNRGCGWSSVPAGFYKYNCSPLCSLTLNAETSEMAMDAHELLEYLKWTDGSVHLVGVSMGGMIAQELALYAPKLFSSLVLTCTQSGLSPAPMRGYLNLIRMAWMGST